MSKIYEALLRAEMDRIAEVNRGAQGEGDARVASPPGTPGAPPNGSAPRSDAASAKQPTEPHPATARVRRVPWEPQAARLPALESRGVLVEQIRTLRSRLHELRLEAPLKSILITSGLPAEGKSFIASNLAVGLARFRNRRVLLIDGDMRRGKLHATLGGPQEPGLTDYLAGHAAVEDVMQQMELSESSALKHLASLTFIPSGSDADDAADLSGNGRFETLLRAVDDYFDWIIVDSSPVTLVADGINLARACDGVVLVARAGTTRYEIAQRAQQELKAAKLVGVVLNAVEGVPQVGGYYGYDG